MSNKIILLTVLSAALTTACASGPHNHGSSNWGIGGGVGTTGVNVEAKYAATNHLVLRGNVNHLPLDRNEEIDDVDYEAELDMTTFGGFADIYPFRSGFHLSGGVYAGDKTVDLIGTPGPATVVEIGDQTYTGAEIGTLRGSAEYSDVAPFLGIGFDGFMDKSRDWSMNVRAGVMFVGSPDVDLTAEGGLSSADPAVQTELQREADNLRDELEDYKYYPVVSVGVTRRF